MRTDTSLSEPAPTRAAATVAVVRDTAAGLEVLLLRRAERGDHNSGAWVFPGGLVDAADREAEAFCTGLDAVAANARLGLVEGGLAFHAAALRECFEEAGLLFADDAHGTPLSGTAVERLDSWRGPLQRGERTLAALCQAERLTLPLARLAYISHWVTPVGRPKRFDTRFFVAEAPADQTALHDDGELVEHLWLRPADAVARGDALKLMAPTLKTLETLAGFNHVAPLMAWARALREVPRWQPNLGTGPQGLRPVAPDEPAWAELGRIDPTGRGDGRYDIRPGVPVRLSPRVIRVTAPNPGVMTGPGTNSYLVGGLVQPHQQQQPQEWAVIDPGPADPTHIAALMAAAPGPIRWILATHTHSDHSPGCALLKAATGAAVLGRLPAHPQRQDATFAPDELLGGGERIALADDTTLRVLHTPGHASNHLCYLLEEEQTLFTGDQVMQRATVVISPPDGDMAAYLGSLQALAGEDLQWLAPGHGFLMAQPQRVFEAIVAHRLQREAKVLAVLQRHGPARAEDLLAAVYDDVPERMHAVALGSLRAHLIHLRQQARVDQYGDFWQVAS